MLCAVSSALYASRMRRVATLACLRSNLVERRESEVLEAVRALIDASRRSSRELLETLDRTLRGMDPAIDTVMVFEAVGEELCCVFVSGDRAEHFSQVRYRLDLDENPVTRAAIDRHRCGLSPKCLPIIPTDQVAVAAPLSLHAPVSIAYVASARAASFNEESIVRLIDQGGGPFSLALERETDRAKATYDGLTGLLTPRAFRTRLQEEVSLASVDSRTSLSLWFIDTDNFKRVNDTFGHGMGDVVLQRMAQIIAAHATVGIDVVARNGGDEFCAIVRNVPKSVAITRAQALCEAVASFNFGLDVPISASIGVASFPIDASSAHELLEVADAAMYFSKRAGRNRVSFPSDGLNFEVFTR